MYIKMNPTLWQYKHYRTHGVELSHDPIKVDNSLGKELLALIFKGKHLTVEVSKSELTHTDEVRLGIYVPPPEEASEPEPKPKSRTRRQKPTETPAADNAEGEGQATDE